MINVVLGVSLWLDYFTNYSIVGKYSEFLFPLLAGIIGFVSYKFLVKRNPDNRGKLLYKLTSAPSVIGGLLSLILIIPPMCLFSFAILNNNSQEIIIQQEISPNNFQVATVYHGYVGFVGGDDKYSIRVHPRWFPLIEKEVYYELLTSPSWCRNDSGKCIFWVDDNTIYISETRQEIKTDKVEFAMPIWLLVIFLVISLVSPK